MRFLLSMCLLSGLYASTLQAQDPAPTGSLPTTEDYDVPLVSKTLQLLKGEGGPMTTIAEKKYIEPLSTLGDRVSIATLKIYSEDDILRTENAHAYLTAVRNAFSSKNRVLFESDRGAGVTRFVLRYLKEKTSNQAIQRRIDYLQGCILAFTCSAQGEFDFLRGS